MAQLHKRFSDEQVAFLFQAYALGKRLISKEEFERLWGSQGNSGVVVRKEPPPDTEGVDLSAWVALMAGLMAAVSMTPLGKERKGIGGMLMGAPTGGGKKPSGAAVASGHPGYVRRSHGRGLLWPNAPQRRPLNFIGSPFRVAPAVSKTIRNSIKRGGHNAQFHHPTRRVNFAIDVRR